VAGILDGLNDAQRRAVVHDAGPLLIVAGAGTGKTTVITRRIAHLITEGKARPHEILALTFTDKAAAEMEERVDQLVPYGYADVEISTFHAFGDRILREHSLEVGLAPDFRVLSRAEQVIFFRDRLFEFPLERYRPLGDPTRHIQAIISLISRCKDEDISPAEYHAAAERFRLEASGLPEDDEKHDRAAQHAELAAVYARYQELMARESAVDFGDQIVLALNLLRGRAHVLNAYQRRFRYILVDEFQDTNHAQFEMVKLLATKHRNVTVVGDDDQCLPPGTPVATPEGPRAIEDVKEGDRVLTAVGHGSLGTSVVTRVFKNRKRARFLTFETDAGTRVTVTSNHKMFCWIPVSTAHHDLTYVYLMEKRSLGWRIGVTNDLTVRLRLERGAERIVGLRAFTSEAEARYHETLWSLKYGIPTLPFTERYAMMIVGPYLERLYGELETRKGAELLAAELGVDLNAHHFAPQAVYRCGQSRAKVKITMCWRRYTPKTRGILKAPQLLHAVSLETSVPEVIERLRAAGWPLAKAKGGWRYLKTSTSLREIGAEAELLSDYADGAVIEARFVVGRGNRKRHASLTMPAGNVLPGHYVPVVRGDEVVYERVVAVTEEHRTSDVYDLEVERTHNFVANGVVVHNSIYKFRGAAISNVLAFIDQYPDAPRIVITENYRSHQAILDAAYRLIKFNDPDRLEAKDPDVSKHLIAAREPMGPEPQHLHYETATQEADAIAAMIEEKVEAGTWKYEDVAILVRSNRDADSYLRSLNLRTIPWTFSGNAGLYGRPEVRLLIAFLRAVAHPDESVSVHYLASSDVYNVPIVDLTWCSTWADRKHRPLYEVLRRVEELPELRDGLTEEGRAAIAAFAADIERFMERAREMPTGDLLYQFLVDSGRLLRMQKAANVRDEAEVQNIAKFFRRVQDAAKALRYDNVREFVKHLDALIDAGDDPAVAEADVETPAVRVLTVHKAKGLEYPVVFLVDLVQDKFPSRTRREALEVPLELRPDARPPADFHKKEERRLFYVGMTRARRELYLTSARDYGGSRQRKVSQFVLEALDLAKDEARPFKSKAVEELERYAPPAETGELALPVIPPEQELTISHKQIDEYQSCPLKYRYSYILRVPQPRHHTMVYGAAIHEVVEFYLRRRAAGNYTSLDDLLAEYEKKWVNQGFLSWEHQEARKKAGRDSLTHFWQQEEAHGIRPSFIEKDFGFVVGNDRVRGRYDRVDEELLGAVIIDYKTSDVATAKAADKRARESLQLKIYALAWREMTGALPERVELRFLESHTLGRHTPTDDDVQIATKAVKAAAEGIRARRFEAAPSYNACRYCPYRQTCPYTATRE